MQLVLHYFQRIQNDTLRSTEFVRLSTHTYDVWISMLHIEPTLSSAILLFEHTLEGNAIKALQHFQLVDHVHLRQFQIGHRHLHQAF